MVSEEFITDSTGNVFADLGLSDPEDRLTKAELAYKISEIIANKRLKQEDAAKLLHITQPKISLILNGKLSGFSLEKLIHFLYLLDQDVKIIVMDKNHSKNDNLIVSLSEATKKLITLFDFPVPLPKHPILASKMPHWDYSEEYLTNCSCKG